MIKYSSVIIYYERKMCGYNEKLVALLIVFMTAMIFVTISSYLAIAELSDFKNAKDTLTIFISIIGLLLPLVVHI